MESHDKESSQLYSSFPKMTRMDSETRPAGILAIQTIKFYYTKIVP